MLDQQFLLKERIRIIEKMLNNLELIKPKDYETSRVSIGSTVTFVEIPEGKEKIYTIVGSIDADPMNSKISIDSPIGKGLLGSKINDEVFIEIPSGKIKVKVLDIG